MREGKIGAAEAVAIVISICVIACLYILDMRIDVVDTKQSDDGEYELTLQSVGEPFLFGSASGRIILKNGDKVIAKADIEVADDGMQIDESTWSVSWYEDRVKITLSGCEQPDQYLTIYFDGEIKEEVKTFRFNYTQETPKVEEPKAEKPKAEEPKYEGPSEEELQIYDGYKAVYLSLGDNVSVDFEISRGAKPSSAMCILNENDKTIEYLIYNRQSRNGACALYVHYINEKNSDGTWSASDAEFLDMYAYVYESGAVVSSGMRAWDDIGSEEYRRVAGE